MVKNIINPIQKAVEQARVLIVEYTWVIIIIVLMGITWYYKRQINKSTTNDYNIINAYKKYPPQISNINNVDAKFKFDQSTGTGHIRDYYIASSYNSCCGGDFQDDYVSLVPLKEVIFHGARVLDFEVFSVDDAIVVAASPNDSFYIKGTYNSLPLGGPKGVLSYVNSHAFAGGTCPNPEDPLFIHLRIKSDKKNIYDKLTKYVKDAFPGRLLDATYGYEGRSDAPGGGKNIATQPLLNFKGKVIIICDQLNNNYRGTSFEELINISGNSAYFKEQRNYNVQYTYNPESLESFNKKNITLSMPDLSALNDNVNAALHFSYGCQMVCMSYQKMDDNMEYYLDKFNQAGSAFILKPKQLRYIPVTIAAPKAQNPKLSYGPKAIALPMYQTSI